MTPISIRKLLNIGLILFYLLHDVFGVEEICHTTSCKEASDDLLHNSMNESVEACDDFYEHVCGKWPTAHRDFDARNRLIDPDYLNNFALLKLQTEEQIFHLMNSSTNPKSQAHSVHFAIDFYHKCLQIDKWSEQGLQPIISQLDSLLNGWPLLRKEKLANSTKSWISQFIQLYSHTELSPILRVDVTNYHNKNYLAIKRGPTGLDSSVLLSPESNDKEIQAYRNYLRNTAVLLGSPNDEKLSADIDKLLKLEIRLAKSEANAGAQKFLVQIGSFEAMNLVTNYTINWLDFANSILSQIGSKIPPFIETDELAVVNLQYIIEALDILESTEAGVVQNLLGWLYLMNYGGFTTAEFRHNKVLFNDYENDYYEKYNQLRCEAMVKDAWPWALNRIFVDEHFTLQALNQTQTMVQEIKEIFYHIMENQTWLDEETRKYAQEKLRAVKQNIGYPKWIQSDAELDEFYDYLNDIPVENGGFMETVMKVHAGIKKKEFKKLFNTENNGQNWQGTIFDANAFYTHYVNSITIPASILQSPFFQTDRPFAMNYGAIGAIIGHEITHGFDSFGYHFDIFGQASDWWAAETLALFTEKTKCFIEQYGAIRDPVAQMNIDGEQTLEENIADNGGLKMAYLAYKNHQNDKTQQVLPGLTLNSDQLFFVSFARNWCNSITKDKLKRLLQGDLHAPNRYRVNVALGNLDQFANAFKCPTGSPMNPIKKCAVW